MSEAHDYPQWRDDDDDKELSEKCNAGVEAKLERQRKYVALAQKLGLISSDEGVSCNPDGVGESANPEEQAYLDLISDIINDGKGKLINNRTGIRTKRLLGRQLRFKLERVGEDGTVELVLPAFTTKRVFVRGVLKELLWFRDGCTDANKLAEKGVNIWLDNTTREALDKRGLFHYREGDCGPVYGFQWRHFNADYVDCETDYTGKGTDQLAWVIDEVKNNQMSRQIVLNAWNAADIHKMALPPCHTMAQFIVDDGKLTCIVTMRSADMGLGVPFNVVSYAVLTAMIAHLAGLGCGELIINMGDTHVYENHIEPLKKQLARTPTAFPTLRIKDGVEGAPSINTIDDFTMANFEVVGYTPQERIQMKMAV